MSTTTTILPILPEDLPTLANIGDAACGEDRNTKFKKLDPVDPPPGDLDGMKIAYDNWCSRPPHTIEMVKAVDQNGTIMGWAVWGIRSFEPTSVSDSTSTDHPSSSRGKAVPWEQQPPKPVDPNASVRHRMESHTTADLQSWMRRFMPDGTKCMYIVSLLVHPAHQGKGVGTALMRHGTDRADREGVFCWVHSSDLASAVRAYERNGFEEVGRLEVDLDAWNEDGRVRVDSEGMVTGDGKWGVYTFRYMRREPKLIEAKR